MISKPQTGSALLEALIAVLLFSFGILGIVAMQATAAKLVADSRYRIEASLLADELMGRIWSDITNAPAYDGLDTNDLDQDPPVTPANLGTHIADNCPITAETVVGASCRWGYKILAALPAARATVSSVNAGIAGSNARVITVTINWTPPGPPDPVTGLPVTRTHDVVSFVTDR